MSGEYDRPNGERNFDRSVERPSGGQPADSNADSENGRRESRRERYERRRAQRIAEQQDANFNGGGFSQAPAPTFIASTEPLGAANGRAPMPLTETAPTSYDAPNIDQPVIREAQPARERPARRERAQAPASDVADHLPAFLSRPTPIAAEAPAPVAETEEPVKPKRGRKRKTEENIGAAEDA
ncbi:MAG: hypothetical protein JF615_06360 [Asticcacaulis sp.]|nr:hypothetical protein [Asticcacaulis sp.]